MSHAEEDSLTHTVFTWIGVLGFLIAVLIPVGNFVFETSIDPLYAGGLLLGSLASVKSKWLAENAPRFIRAWRSGE